LGSCNYSKEALEGCLKEIKNKKISICSAADKWVSASSNWSTPKLGLLVC
jgi:hypothetical protein